MGKEAAKPREETPERLRRAGDAFEDVLVTDESGRQFLRRKFMDGHILSRLQSRDDIDGYQYAAGEQFYADWYASGLAASGVVDPAKEPVDGSPPQNISEFVMAARQRYHKAVKAMNWLHLHILNQVLLNEETLESYGDRMMWRFYKPGKNRTRAALNRFRDALTMLDHHYTGKVRSLTIRSQMSDDARPEDRPELREG